MDPVEINRRYRDTVVDINAISRVRIEGQEATSTQIGTGFFIDGYRIVTNAHVVLLPPGIERIPNGNIPGFVPSQRILVTVYRVNGKDQNFIYNARIIGVDRMIDVALLELLPTDGSPKLECHPYLEWIDNKKVPIGSSVYVIGNTVAADVRSFSAGVVRDNRYPFIGNPFLPEQLTIDAPVGSGNSGGPVLTPCGRAVGIIQGSILDDGREVDLNRAVTSTVAQVVISNLLCPTLQWTELINLDLEYVTPDFFLQDPNGNVDPSKKLSYTRLVGVDVAEDPSVSNPLVGIISKSDIITHVNDTLIGLDSPSQTSIGTALLCVPPGDYVTLCYLRAAEQYRKQHLVKVQVVAISPNDEL